MARRNSYVTEAQARAVVRFDPEVAALQALLKQAQQTFQQGVRSARGSARYAIGEIDKARPQVSRVYSVPGLDPKAAIAAPELPEAGALDFNAAATFESQAAQRRFGQARADALADLGSQRASTAQGAQFGAQQARSQYIQDVGTISDRLVSLAGQKGAFIVSELGKIEAAEAQRSLTRRGQNVTARGQTISSRDRAADRRERERHNREQEAAARERERNDQAAAGKPKSQFTPVQRRATVKVYRTGLDALGSLQVPKSGDHAVAAAKEILLNGLKADDGKTWIQKSVTDDRVLAGIMAERYIHGSLSRASYQKLLRRYGVKGKYFKPGPVGESLNPFG